MPLNLNIITPPVFTGTATLASGSAAVTGLGSAYVPLVGQAVEGTGVPTGATVATVTDAATFTLSGNATASGAQALTFGGEPVTLAEAKLHCRVEITDDDTLIDTLITAARRACEARTKRSFVATQYEQVTDSFPFGGGYYNRMVRQFYGAFPGASGATWPGFLPTNTGIIELPHPPLIRIDAITYLDSGGSLQTLDPANYAVVTGTPGRLNPAYGKIWPVTYPQVGAVRVKFTCGYATPSDVPANYRQAILMLVKDLYDRRNWGNDQKAGNVTINDTVACLLDADEWGGYA